MSDDEVAHVYDALVIEGGGMLAHSIVGALHELDKIGILKGIKRFAGASAGAGLATMLAAGFTVTEIEEALRQLDLRMFEPKCMISNLWGLWRRYGIHYNTSLEDAVVSVVGTKIPRETTLKDLFEKTGNDLVISVCCINRQRAVYLHHAQFPNVRVIDALCCSMCIPIIFQPRLQTFLGSEDMYVDGGLVDNMPLWVFNDIEKLYSGNLLSVNRNTIPNTTLGLKMFVEGEDNSLAIYDSRTEISSVADFALGMLNTLMRRIERSAVSDSWLLQTIPIHLGNISSTDFSMSTDDISNLQTIGTQSVKSYFKRLI